MENSTIPLKNIMKMDNYRRGTFLNGLKHRDYIEFFDNGNISLKCTFVNGVEEGPFEQYMENGELEYQGVFKNGEIVQTLFVVVGIHGISQSRESK